MQSLKKYVLFVLMAVFAASLAIVPAHAQGARVVVDVPFDFAVGSTQFKAGSYRIETQGTLGTFVVFSQYGGKTAYSILSPGSYAPDGDRQPYLIFNRYGVESFLTKVVFSSKQTYNLPRGSREKEMMAHATPDDQMEVPAGASR